MIKHKGLRSLAAFLTRRSIATWASFVAKAIPLFILPPFIFSNFTAEQTAIWFILITLQSLQLLIASSTGQPMVRGFAYALGGATQVRDMRNVTPQADSAPNMDLMGRVWSASSFAHVLIGIATLGVLAGMGIWSAAPLIAELAGQNALWGALAVFVVGGALRAYGGQQVSYLIGVNRIALLRWWETAFWLLSFAAALGAVLAGGGLLEIALAYQIPLILNILWNVRLCQQDQALRPGFQRAFYPDLDILAQMWPAIWKTGLGTFIYLGATQGAGLYYATVGEAQNVAAFLFAMSLIRPLGQFAQVPFITKLPQLARMQAKGERDAQRRIAQRSMRLSYILHASMVLGVAIMLPLVSGLLGSTVDVPTLLWLLIGIVGYVERMGSMHLQLHSSTNQVLVHWANGLAALVFVALSWVLFPVIGAYGFPAAQIGSLVLAYCPIGMINSYRTFNLPVPGFEIRSSAFPLLALVTSIVINLLITV